MHLSIIQIVSFFNLLIFTGGEITYKIIVPEFICDKDGEVDENHKNTTTIEFIGDVNIDYFKLDFETISNPCRNTQRCNLIAWRAIRQFEKYLNNYPHTQTNYIEFNNSMLVPGLKYIINIFISKGDEKDQKQVSLNFVDKNYARSKPLASVSLIGISSTETQMSYIINARISICSNVKKFYFRWELLDESNSFVKIFPDRSSELIVPPFTFQSGRTYIIKCYLRNLDNDDVIAENSQSVTVKGSEESLVVKLPMVYTTVKVQQSVTVRPFIRDLTNQGEDIKKTWSCVYENKEDVCENYNDDELYIEGGFLNEGQYNISLTVTKGVETKSVFSVIKVLKEVPSIEIHTIETPVLPSSGIRIKSYIEDLRTFCTLQWKSEEGSYSIDLNSVPGDVNEVHHVIARRDLFLRELEEFSSDVINKDYTLIIPPKKDDWNGLPNLNEDYKLRFILEVKCPKAQLDDNDIDVELSQELFNDSVAVSALVEIDVVVTPKLQSLEVVPETGIALETMFTFKCEEATKSGVTHPFVYRFGYFIGDRGFVFSNQLGFRKTESILPYSDAVKTFVEVCDDFTSCERIFGPIIKTSLASTIDKKNILNLFEDKLNTEDFYKAFGYASSILTITEINEFNGFFFIEILEKIQYLLNTYNNEDVNWGKRVKKLIENIKYFSKEISFSEDVLNGLSELREKFVMKQKSKLLVLQRNLLATSKKKITLENFKSYVDVSDLIITSSSDEERVEAEKQLLVQKVNEYFLGRLCAQLYEKHQIISLEYQNVIIVLEKLPRRSYSNMHTIPFEGNSWDTFAELKLDTETLEKLNKDKLCIGKMLYKNFFNKTGISYGVNVFDGDGETLILESLPTRVLIPVNNSQVTDSVPKCALYNSGWNPNCTFTNIISKFAQCSCPTTGTYYLDYEIIPPLSTMVTKLSTEYYKLTEIVTESSKKSTEFKETTKVITTGASTTTLTDNIEANEGKGSTASVTMNYDATNLIFFNQTVESVSTTKDLKISTEIVTNPVTTMTIRGNLDGVTDVSPLVTDNVSLSHSPDVGNKVFDDTTTGGTESSPNKGTVEPEVAINDLSSEPGISTHADHSAGVTIGTTEPIENGSTIVSGFTETIVDWATVTDNVEKPTEVDNKETTASDSMTSSTTSSFENTVSVDSKIDLELIDEPLVPTVFPGPDDPVTESISDIDTEEMSSMAGTVNDVTAVQDNSQGDLTKTVPTQTSQNGVKTTTSSVTASMRTTTAIGQKGVFQAGINGNFHTNFSVNFFLNTAFGR